MEKVPHGNLNRVPCDPEFVATDKCALYRKIGKCFMDKHHLYFPRKDYRTDTEKQFRELDENKVEICRNFHNMEHAVTPPPSKPDVELMELAILEQKNRKKAL